MTCAKRIQLISIFCFALSDTSVGQVPAESHEKFLCTSGPQKRVISIYNRTAPDGNRELMACRVEYTKSGKTTALWTSKTDHAYCTGKALSLVTKLAEAHYSCKPEAVEQSGATDAPE